jgi:hypothetical protein
VSSFQLSAPTKTTTWILPKLIAEQAAISSQLSAISSQLSAFSPDKDNDFDLPEADS